MGKLRYQFLYSQQPMLSFVEGNFVLGASGVPRTVKGAGIKSVTRLAAGTYQIVLTDVFPRYLVGSAGSSSVPSGTNIDPATMSVGSPYMIISAGNTPFNTLGLPQGINAVPGAAFVATAAASAGTTGLVQALSPSAISDVQIVGDPNATINQPALPYIIIQCLNSSQTPTDPAQNSVIGFQMMLKNSTAKAGNE